ncbi:MAG: extracellular solute-binding protein [bacterium]|nr:extracellular solute-binding protein [bacterium]
MNPFFVLSSTRIKLIAAIVAVVLVIFLVLYFGMRNIGGDPKVTLTVWGVFDNKEAFDALKKEYRNIKPNVTIEYVKISGDVKSYEKDLIDALAAGTGPDIFMIQNNWLPKHQSKIVPLDPKLQTLLGFPFVTFRDAFPKVVSDDFVRDTTTIYASPLNLDTLAMYYNRDYFDRKGIAIVPSTWSEFNQLVPRLREINPTTNEIFKAAAAIGGSNTSVNRATDLIALLMMQYGAEFTNSEGKYATFANGSDTNNYGLQGLKYYTNFAKSDYFLYTWNERLHYSIDNFAEGNTAIMFNYAYQIPAIKQKNPFLDFRIAPMPQVDINKPINYASYWGLTVSRQSRNPSVAWDFITFATTNKKSANAYAKETGKPPALLSLIDANLNDQDLGVFAKQALTAKSWFQIDYSAIEDIFSDIISSVLSGKLTAEVALKKAEDMVTQLMK